MQGRWLWPGTHLDLLHGFTPGMREADDACFIDASLFIDTEDALARSGDLLSPLQRGLFTVADGRVQLHGLCTSTPPGRTREAERTVFKSVGTALEDLAAAMLALLSVKCRGVHAPVPILPNVGWTGPVAGSRLMLDAFNARAAVPGRRHERNHP